MSIEVRNINKTFGGFSAVKDVSLHVRAGELVALLGPSGSGKTTLLRIIAGLEQPDAGTGSILFHQRDVTGQQAADRRVGFVFQHYALFRHMTVFENVAFGLKVRPRNLRPSKAEIHEKVVKLLELVQLDRLADRYPAQLSGGQRQRVALARALAVEPKVLLLDEPFGALDAKVRRELRRWLRKLHDEIEITSLFVTHDQEEALEVADRIAVMNAGRIEQVGAPQEVYDRPVNPFVYNFLGNVNLFHGRLHEGQLELKPDGAVAAHDGKPPAVAYVRPHDIALSRGVVGPASVTAEVKYVTAAGPIVRVHLQDLSSREMIEAELSRDRYRALSPAIGEKLFVSWENASVFVDDYTI